MNGQFGVRGQAAPFLVATSWNLTAATARRDQRTPTTENRQPTTPHAVLDPQGLPGVSSGRQTDHRQLMTPQPFEQGWLFQQGGVVS